MLRYIVGFGETILYQTSDVYEYEIQPNQDVQRFHNRIFINREGMRSGPLHSGEFRILKFGDSILNGGAGCDQTEIASERLNKAMRKDFPEKNVRVLNVSAGSWGVENAFLWMKQHGDQGAKMIILVFSSHDYHDFMTFQNVVGNTDFYPAKQPLCAITDALGWIGSRLFSDTDWNSLGYSKKVNYDTSQINPGWREFIDYTRKNKIPLLVYHHAELSEMQANSYSKEGVALQAFLKSQQVPYLSDLTDSLSANMYRDNLHFNPEGQRYLARLLAPYLREFLTRSDEY